MFGIPKEVFNDLVDYYNSLGISARLVEKGEPEAFNGETTIKIGGRQFDTVILKFAGGSMAGGGGFSIGPSISKKVTKTSPKLNFHHVITASAQGKSEEDLKAEMEEEKTGFITKKLVNISWKDGRLASILNNDADLKKKILDSQTTSFKVEPDMKNNSVRIVHQKEIELIYEFGGVFIKTAKTSAKNFPPITTIDIIDKIAEHVKSI
jgi:hypothetical protein